MCNRPGLSSIVMGYLPSVILNGFIYVVPFAMFGIAKVGGSISRSKVEMKTCNMVFYFLVGNVFFLSLISGSLLEEIGESFEHPKNFPSHLARAVSSQVSWNYMIFVSVKLQFSLNKLILHIKLLTFCSPGRFLYDLHLSRWAVSIFSGGSSGWNAVVGLHKIAYFWPRKGQKSIPLSITLL